MSDKNYYEILEVAPTASAETIRGAYKALSKKYHPDVFAGNKEEANRRMAELNTAYDVLSNPEKRKEYDKILGAGKTGWTAPQGNNETNAGTAYSPNSQNRSSTSSASTYSSAQTPPPKASQNQSSSHNPGCFGGLIKLLVWIFIIYFVISIFRFGPSGAIGHIKSIWNKTDSESNTNMEAPANGPLIRDNGQSEAQIGTGTLTSEPSSSAGNENSPTPVEDNWDTIPLVSDNGSTLYAALPDELSDTLEVNEGQALAAYNTDTSGVMIYAFIHGEDTPMPEGWKDERIDSSYDGTAHDFMFEVVTEEIYKEQIVAAFLELGAEPSVQTKTQIIGGVEWSTRSYTGETSIDEGIHLTMTIYFCADNYATTALLVTDTYSIHDATSEERTMMEYWLDKITSSFEVRHN